MAVLLVMGLGPQLASGLLIAVALPRLPAVTTSLLLLIQPVLAVVFAMWLVGERPSPMQLAGVGLVLAVDLIGQAVSVEVDAADVKAY